MSLLVIVLAAGAATANHQNCGEPDEQIEFRVGGSVVDAGTWSSLFTPGCLGAAVWTNVAACVNGVHFVQAVDGFFVTLVTVGGAPCNIVGVWAGP